MFQQIPGRIKGVIYVLMSAFMYASLPILAKIAYASGLQPVQSLLLRYLFASIILIPYIYIVKRESLSLTSPLALLQGALLIGGSLLYFVGLPYLPAGLFTVIFFTYPVLVPILDILILHSQPDIRLIMGIVLAVAGILLIFGWSDSPRVISFKGLTLALLSSLCYAFYSLVGQKTITRNSSLSLTLIFCLIGVASMLTVTAGKWSFMFSLTFSQMVIVLSMALFNTILSVSFFLKGVQKIGASWASLVSIAEPVITLIMAFFILGETLFYHELIGSSLVFFSLLLAIMPRKGKNHQFLPQ